MTTSPTLAAARLDGQVDPNPGIAFADRLDGSTPDDLVGLLRTGPAPGSLDERFAVLERAHAVVVARDHGLLVGLAAAIDTATVLEVRPSHQGRGLESELARRIVSRLRGPGAA
jgi:hypothetical protein